MIGRYLVFVALLAPLVSFSQFKKIKTFELNEAISSAAVDRPGELYLTTIHDKLQKFDKEGNIKSDHKNTPAIDLFDPRDGARLFAFYRHTRQYAFLNPDFEILTINTIDSAFAIEPWLACSSGDFNLWVIDVADQSLKKINTNLNRIEAEVKLSNGLKSNDILYLREYQGFLFILSKKTGIHIFNSMGKSIKNIALTKISYFNFLGEELYYLQSNQLKFFDLFSTETREVTLPSPCRYALITDERLYLVNDKSVEVFEANFDK